MIALVESGELRKMINRSLYTFADLENDIMNHYVTERYDNVFNAIDTLEYMLEKLPKPADKPDWYANILSWSGVGKEVMSVVAPAVAAAGFPEVDAAVGVISLAIEALKAQHESASNLAKEVQAAAGPDATWHEMLHKWKAQRNKLQADWKAGVQALITNLREAVFKDPTLDWSPVVWWVWNLIKQAPGPKDWFNSFYAQIMDTTHQPAGLDRSFMKPKSNANYFVQSTRNGKLYFQGVMFTPQPGPAQDYDACKIVQTVLQEENNGCWNPSTPGLQGFTAQNSSDGGGYPEVPPATGPEQVGDFKVLVSVDDKTYFQYDCKTITGKNYDADSIIDEFEGCYNSDECGPPIVGVLPCENRFWSRTDQILLGPEGKPYTCGSFFLNTDKRKKNVLDGLKLGGIDFCRNQSYIKPESNKVGARTKYSVAAVNWHDTSLCEQCKGKSLENVFRDHECINVGTGFDVHDTTPADKCAAIPQPGGGSGGPWCNGHDYNFAEYCWGWCMGGCWGGYEEVQGCRSGRACSFGSAPLCKRTSSSLLALDEPTKPTIPGCTGGAGDQEEESCILAFEPYVQCSASGDECWLDAAEVSGDGLVWTNGTFTWMSFDLSGLQVWCVNPPDDVENACSIQLHEGTSCSSDVGAVLGSSVGDNASNPFSRHLYRPVKSDAVGAIMFPVEPDVASGKTLVVHGVDGSPVACAVIPASCLTTDSPTSPPLPTDMPTSPPTSTTTTTTLSDTQCRACNTMCAPCQTCRDSQTGDCEKCWHCHDYDDDDDDDDDDDEDSECLALGKKHDWDDEEVQCLSEKNDDCRLCWQSQFLI
jgi:hypothetical protein